MNKGVTAVLALAAVLAVGIAIWMVWLLHDLPDVGQISDHLAVPSIRITDRKDRLLYEMLPGVGGRHTTIPLEKIPKAMLQATVATEDSHFYTNPGFDPVGILRSVWINLRGGQTLAGGSTITQQVARSTLMDEEERSQRTLRRKIREVALAWQINQRYTKDEILAFYLNQTYYGKLSYGVEAAARTYFGKSAESLDLAEAALLAGLPQAPGLYDPFENLEAAKKRQAVVLGLMEKQGMITASEARLAEQERLVLAESSYPMEAPHFVMMVRSQLDRMFSPELLQGGKGWTVKTTLDLDWQRLAEDSVADQLKKLRNQPSDPLGHNVNSAALVAIDPRNGEILAMIGSPDYFDAANAGAVNMALSPRQPGSALKPLIYADAFDPQQKPAWTAGTMILDVTTHFTTHNGETYTPVNYDGLEHGPVLAREALGSSLNIPAVITLNHIGLTEFYSFANRLGISTLNDPDQADLSVALGGGEVSLLDLAAAYGVFASGGYRVEPYAIQSITDPAGVALYRHTPPASKRALDERVAWLISNILSDDESRMIGFGRNSILKLDRPAAVKTGTTTNFHDNWTVGYTPSLVVGVWVGNTSHEAMRNVTGLTGAAPIWAQMMRSALSGKPEESFIRPKGLAQVEICAQSGMLPTPACPNRKLEWFIEGTQPNQEDTLFRQVEIDTATGLAADPATPLGQRAIVTGLDLPPAAESWARSHGLTLWSSLIKGAAGIHIEQVNPPVLQLTAPAPNSVFLISSKLPLETQRIQLKAAGVSGLAEVTFWVDDRRVGSVAAAPFETWWQLTPGNHTARVSGVDKNGASVEGLPVAFEVR